MGRKLRVMVAKRKEACDRVLGALTVQGAEISDELGLFLKPVSAAGEALPDVTTLLLLCGRRLEGYCDAMVAADQAHLLELARLESLRDETIEPMRGLKESILSLRATCQGLFGQASLPALGLDFNIARNPQGVLRQAEIVRSRLANVGLTMMAKPWLNGSLDSHAALAELDRDIEPLRDLLARRIEQRKRIDTAKVRKDLAIEEFDRHFLRITRLIESAFRVAGEDELADRIRPAARRLGREGGADDERRRSESQIEGIEPGTVETKASPQPSASPPVGDSSAAEKPRIARRAAEPSDSSSELPRTDAAPLEAHLDGHAADSTLVDGPVHGDGSRARPKDRRNLPPDGRGDRPRAQKVGLTARRNTINCRTQTPMSLDELTAGP